MKIIKGLVISLACSLAISGLANLSAFAAPVNADIALNSVKVLVNGKTINANNLVYQDSTYVPLRAVFEEIGCKVGWDEATQTASIDGDVKAAEDLVKTYTSYDEEYADLKDRYDLLIENYTTKDQMDEVEKLKQELIDKTELLKKKYEVLKESSPIINYQKLEAEFDAINIVVNGEKIDETNILYNDHTYIPLRKISETIGCDVNWDEATRSAYITGEIIPENEGLPQYDNYDEAYVATKEKYDKWIAEQEALGKQAYEDKLKQSVAATGGQAEAQELLALQARKPYDDRIEELKQEFEQRVKQLKEQFNVTE